MYHRVVNDPRTKDDAVMANFHPLAPLSPWTLLPGMVCLDRDEFDTSGGGGGSDDDDDEEDDEEDEKDADKKADKSKKSGDDDEDDEDDDDEKDLDEKAKGILRKNRKEARQAKARAKRAEEALEALKKGKGKGDDDDKSRDRETEAEAEARGAKKGMDLALRSSVRAELLAAGLNVGDDKPRALKRAMRLIDFEDLSIDDDGDVDGLDDAIAELREEMPSLFAKPKKSTRKINGEDSRGGGKTRSKSASERQAEALAKNG